MCPDNNEPLSVSAYAFLGDGVWGLLVRKYLAVKLRSKAGELHEMSSKMVSASYQAAASKIIMEHLTQEEKSVFIRGRNAHTPHTPKNQSKSDYRAATGLEALFGKLYIDENSQRIEELFNIIINGESSEV